MKSRVALSRMSVPKWSMENRYCGTCGEPMALVEMLHIPTGTRGGEFYQCPKGCAVYEVEGLRDDGDAFTIEIMQRASDADAITLARQFGLQWSSAVRLYRVPAVNLTSCASRDFWPDMPLILEIPKQ
jgi:hypothetical protein